MEPCLFRHGKRIATLGEVYPELLQWSHVFSDMVRVMGDAYLGTRDADASMEPCLFRHGKHNIALQV